MREDVTKRIVVDAEDWAREREKVLSYDHPGVDWLFVQIENPNDPHDVRFETYDMAKVCVGDYKPEYQGDEFPEAISTMF